MILLFLIYYNISTNEWKIVNKVIHDFIISLGEVNLWIINVIQYSAIVTLLNRHNKLNIRKEPKSRGGIPTWIIHRNEKINAIRRKISYITLIIDCRKNNKELTKHQLTIVKKLRKWFGKTNDVTLSSKLAILKHELKLTTENLRQRKTIMERNAINGRFQSNQKQVFRNWKSKKIEIKENPGKEEITGFWTNIWGKETTYNTNAAWLNQLETDYHPNPKLNDYNVTPELFQDVIKNMKNNGAPGHDLIRSYWIKKLHSTHDYLTKLISKLFENDTQIPQWLATSRTILNPKTEETRNAKNYRPIACQNITYKIYTGILNKFLENHCINNDIITLEQAGGKKESWGCTDQLLINKMILDEVKKHKRNLFVMWYDYKKAFDSMPHNWMLKALALAKVPPKLISAIDRLSKVWATIVSLHGTKETITTDTINYLTGLLQGDCLSLLLFIISVNPLSYLLQKLPGYNAGPPGRRENMISHLFFVDDLKTYAKNIDEAKIQADMITQFTNDIGMEFGEDKCRYLYIENGKRKTLDNAIDINGLQLNELEEGDTYKYLGQDEAVGFNSPLNKE